MGDPQPKGEQPKAPLNTKPERPQLPAEGGEIFRAVSFCSPGMRLAANEHAAANDDSPNDDSKSDKDADGSESKLKTGSASVQPGAAPDSSVALVENTPVSKDWAQKVVVIGGGSYGTAIAHRLAQGGEDVMLWDRRSDTARGINRERRNPHYLKDVLLSETLRATESLSKGLEDRGVIIVAIPSHALQERLPQIKPHPQSLVISLTKGLIVEGWDPKGDPVLVAKGPPVGSRVLTPLQYMRTLEGWKDVEGLAVAAGPGFAKNIVNGCRFGITVASHSDEARLQAYYVLAGKGLLVETSNDPVAVEVAAAMKNVIAVAAGVVQGLKRPDGTDMYGTEEIELLKAQGMKETARIVRHLGGHFRNLNLFSGWADLNLTTKDGSSRNNQVGRDIAAGLSIVDILGQRDRTAEGVYAAWAVKRMTDPVFETDGSMVRSGLYTPLTNALIDIIQKRATPHRIIDVFFEKNGTLKKESIDADPFGAQYFPLD